MTINNRGLSGQPVLPYVDYRSYMGADVFIDLTFLDHTGNPVNPTQVSYRVDDLTNAVPMIPNTSIVVTNTSATGSVGFNGSGSITGDVMTITGFLSGIIMPGDTVFGAGVPAGTKVLFQATGSGGTSGTFKLNFPLPIATGAIAVTTTSNYLYVTAVNYGVFAVGDLVVNSQWQATLQASVTPPVPLTGTLWLLAGSQLGPFGGVLSVASKLPSSYTLQIPGAQLQMTHNWQGSQICQVWLTSIWTDPVTNQTATAQGVSVIELCAIQTPNGAL